MIRIAGACAVVAILGGLAGAGCNPQSDELVLEVQRADGDMLDRVEVYFTFYDDTTAPMAPQMLPGMTSPIVDTNAIAFVRDHDDSDLWTGSARPLVEYGIPLAVDGQLGTQLAVVGWNGSAFAGFATGLLEVSSGKLQTMPVTLDMPAGSAAITGGWTPGVTIWPDPMAGPCLRVTGADGTTKFFVTDPGDVDCDSLDDAAADCEPQNYCDGAAPHAGQTVDPCNTFCSAPASTGTDPNDCEIGACRNRTANGLTPGSCEYVVDCTDSALCSSLGSACTDPSTDDKSLASCLEAASTNRSMPLTYMCPVETNNTSHEVCNYSTGSGSEDFSNSLYLPFAVPCPDSLHDSLVSVSTMGNNGLGSGDAKAVIDQSGSADGSNCHITFDVLGPGVFATGLSVPTQISVSVTYTLVDGGSQTFSVLLDFYADAMTGTTTDGCPRTSCTSVAGSPMQACTAVP